LVGACPKDRPREMIVIFDCEEAQKQKESHPLRLRGNGGGALVGGTSTSRRRKKRKGFNKFRRGGGIADYPLGLKG